MFVNGGYRFPAPFLLKSIFSRFSNFRFSKNTLMEVPGVIFLYSIVKYRKEIEEKEGWRKVMEKERERERLEKYSREERIFSSYSLYMGIIIFHICHNQSGNDNNVWFINNSKRRICRLIHFIVQKLFVKFDRPFILKNCRKNNYFITDTYARPQHTICTR